MYQKFQNYYRYIRGEKKSPPNQINIIPRIAHQPKLPPSISIITSVFNGDYFIEQFLYEIIQQTIFDQCELILINANSPGNEQHIIFEYMKHYSNIIYIKLGYDPGLYGVWNIGINIAKGKYLTNANLDDRIHYDCYKLHMQALDENSAIDLVYSDIYVTYKPNEIFTKHSAREIQESAEFSIKNMQKCLPNDHPMWRKTLHTKHGLFDEKYTCIGDYEMWLRAVAGGSCFKKVPGILGLHYANPQGLSTNQNNPIINKEVQEVQEKYKFLWKE